MTACFRTIENTIFNVSNFYIPCSGSNPTGCCFYGDFCLSNGMCQYTKPTTVESGYYLQSSTDSTFQSPTGQETLHCTTLNHPDIVYNPIIGRWACCSSDATTGVHCSTATNETWAAPAPAALATITSLQQAPPQGTSTSPEPSQARSSNSFTPSPAPLASSTTVSSSPTHLPSSPAPVSASTLSTSHTASPSTSRSSSSSTSTTATLQNSAAAATATATSASSPSNSTHKTGLSAGLDTGIGIGVAVGLFVLIALLIFTLRGTQMRRRQSSVVLFGGPDPTLDHHTSGQPEMGSANTGSGGDYHVPPRPPRFTGEPQFSFAQGKSIGG